MYLQSLYLKGLDAYMKPEEKQVLFERAKGFYNADRKIEFLHYVDDQMSLNSVKTLVVDVFESSRELEDFLEKDLAEFCSNELQNLFVRAEWTKKTYFMAARMLINRYAAWCEENGYVHSLSFSIKEIKRSSVLEESVKTIYPFKSCQQAQGFFYDLFNIKDPNYLNANCMRYFSVLMVWQGVDFADVFRLKKTEMDLENRTAMVNGRSIPLTEEIVRIAKYCMGISKLKVRHIGDSFREYDLEDSDYVIRSSSIRKRKVPVKGKMDPNYSLAVKKLIRGLSWENGQKFYHFSYENLFYNGILARAVEYGDLTLVKEYELEDDFNAYGKYYRT